ncbi:hypothetical protein SLEP1_g54493 [Rubroshorea leprosula]|uniref:Uncharacterized protein n=1 Tax=Rubroshorea leprosula TaxID=152421 RepID=A0AAV5MDN1_9ROSI|nr:hypothetical protein SLEP1_g54493 [Rubroshorea leprosula]
MQSQSVMILWFLCGNNRCPGSVQESNLGELEKSSPPSYLTDFGVTKGYFILLLGATI